MQELKNHIIDIIMNIADRHNIGYTICIEDYGIICSIESDDTELVGILNDELTDAQMDITEYTVDEVLKYPAIFTREQYEN